MTQSEADRLLDRMLRYEVCAGCGASGDETRFVARYYRADMQPTHMCKLCEDDWFARGINTLSDFPNRVLLTAPDAAGRAAGGDAQGGG